MTFIYCAHCDVRGQHEAEFMSDGWSIIDDGALCEQCTTPHIPAMRPCPSCSFEPSVRMLPSGGVGYCVICGLRVVEPPRAAGRRI